MIEVPDIVCKLIMRHPAPGYIHGDGALPALDVLEPCRDLAHPVIDGVARRCEDPPLVAGAGDGAAAGVLQQVLNETPWLPVMVALMMVAFRSVPEVPLMPPSEELP